PSRSVPLASVMMGAETHWREVISSVKDAQKRVLVLILLIIHLISDSLLLQQKDRNSLKNPMRLATLGFEFLGKLSCQKGQQGFRELVQVHLIFCVLIDPLVELEKLQGAKL